MTDGSFARPPSTSGAATQGSNRRPEQSRSSRRSVLAAAAQTSVTQVLHVIGEVDRWMSSIHAGHRGHLSRPNVEGAEMCGSDQPCADQLHPCSCAHSTREHRPAAVSPRPNPNHVVNTHLSRRTQPEPLSTGSGGGCGAHFPRTAIHGQQKERAAVAASC